MWWKMKKEMRKIREYCLRTRCFIDDTPEALMYRKKLEEKMIKDMKNSLINLWNWCDSK